MIGRYLVALASLAAHLVVAVPVVDRAVDPTVTLDTATVTGVSSNQVSKFLGIPFAKPPTGDRRFRLPEAISSYSGTVSAKAYGLSCPQQAINLPLDGLAGDAVNYIIGTIFGGIFPDSEDCLTINVVKPASATSASKLPVAVWIFGGGFELGGTTMYDGESIVKRSIEMGKPAVYVSMNYRVTGFGFMAGKEIKAAGVGNLGLHDQREAFRWTKKYISAFGGDPSKVTIWGESAGAISAALHLVSEPTAGLFRGAFMQSGAQIPVGDIANGQKYYDAVVSQTGCSGSADTLACLRKVDYSVLKKAINASPGIFSYQSLLLAWLPRVDGVFLKDNPQKLLQQGAVSNVPFVTGNCDDEGTLFSLSSLNITTDTALKTWLKTYWLPKATDAEIATALTHYPQDITKGSPFDTGIYNALSSQSKRIAAFQGDAVFQAPRRFFLDQVSGKQNAWVYLNKRLKAIPALGAAHGTDILNVYGGGDLADYLINFVTDLNPSPNWPKYTSSSRNLLVLSDGLIQRNLEKDDYRVEPMKFLSDLTLKYPI